MVTAGCDTGASSLRALERFETPAQELEHLVQDLERFLMGDRLAGLPLLEALTHGPEGRGHGGGDQARADVVRADVAEVPGNRCGHQLLHRRRAGALTEPKPFACADDPLAEYVLLVGFVERRDELA